MISPLNIFCWIGYLIWWGGAGLYLANHDLENYTDFQIFSVFAAGMLVVWLLMSRLFKGTSQDEDFEPEESST